MKKTIPCLLLLLATTAFIARWQSSGSELDRLPEMVRSHAMEERIRTNKDLAALKLIGERDLVQVSLSSSFLERLLATSAGTTYHHPSGKGTLTIESLKTGFENGYPRVIATLRAEVPKLAPERLQAEACLTHRLSADGTRADLQVHFLGIESKRDLPRAIREIASAEAVARINSRLEPFRVPLPVDFSITPEKSVDQELQVKVGGSRVNLALSVPSLPPVQVHWRLLSIWFTKQGFHAAGRISMDGLPPSPLPEVAIDSDKGLDAELARFQLPAGEDFRARLPIAPLEQTAANLSMLPATGRTVTVQGIGAKGDLIAKTGGLPFGNGFRAWIENVRGLKLSAEASQVTTTLQENLGLDLGARITVQGKGRVRAHGNAPKVFGVRIGGGAGTSADITASAAADLLTTLRPDPDDGSLVLRLAGPEKLKVKATVHAHGRHDVSGSAPLPLGTELYRIPLPAVIDRSFSVDLPEGMTPARKHFSTGVKPTALRFGKESIELGAKVTLTEQQP